MNEFKRFIHWGHMPFTHTHAYVAAAFVKAFKFLGYESAHIDGTEVARNIYPPLISGSLILTEGQVDAKLPRDKDATYILHNCDVDSYRRAGCRYIVLQVYTRDCLNQKVEKLAPFTFWDRENRTLYQPWATDLLPHEIDVNVNCIGKRGNVCPYVGTVGAGKFGNIEQVIPFQAACEADGKQWRNYCLKNDDKHREIIQTAFLAPSLQGAWQLEKHYIPCRAFKNVSYGHLGLFNLPVLEEIFGTSCVTHADGARLYHIGRQVMEDEQHSDWMIRGAMLNVRNNHTYLNRIHMILKCLEECQ